VSVTNEGAFGASSGPHQTLAMNAFRAVENRVAIARAATTGVSAFIDSNGAIVARVKDETGRDLVAPGVLVRDVALTSDKTLYTLHGDVFAQAVASAASLMVVAAAVATMWRPEWRGGISTAPVAPDLSEPNTPP